MNILFISNIATPYQLELLEEMNSKENTKMYGYFLFSKEKNREWNLDLPGYVNVANFNKDPNDYYKIYKFIRDNNINKIIIGGYSLPMIYFIVFLSKIKSIDLFFWLERPINRQYGIKKILKDMYIKVILLQAKKIFAIGKIAKNIYSQYVNNVVNLPYSMNLDKYYMIKREKIKDRKIKFLFSGQYIDRKNIINTILAFKNIVNPNIELNLIGGGELEKEVNELINADARINNIGFVQPKDLPYIYAQNDVFLMPSKHDGWALVINEAMASGMPIISTNQVGAVVEYIQSGINGEICDTELSSIQQAIEKYIKNKDLIYIHGNVNRNIIKDSLADAKNASSYIFKQLNTIKT